MFGLSKIISFIMVFVLGFSIGVGAVVGGTAVVLTTCTVRDLERQGVPIPDESFIGENPEVDILDLNVKELISEWNELQTFGDDLNLNLIQKRYALIFNDKVDALLTDSVREMPIKKLLSQEGVNSILSSVYLGNIQKYECRVDIDGGYEVCEPTAEGAYWVTAEGKKVSPLEQEIANWTIASFMDGEINTDTILNKFTVGQLLGYTKNEEDGKWYDGNGEKVSGVVAAFADSKFDTIGDDVNNLIVGELLGYEKNEEDGKWYDSENYKVTGVMAVFADCKLDNIGNKMEESTLGELLGYEKIDDAWYENDENGELKKVSGAMAVLADSGINDVSNTINTTKLGSLLGYELISDGENETWYNPDDLDEDGNAKPVSGFMGKVANKTIDTVDEIFSTLVIGDVVKEEDRETGIFAIIPADTAIDNIGSAVNDSIMGSPLQFFINEGLISFKTKDESTGTESNMEDVLDGLSGSDKQKKFIYETDENFEDSKKYYEHVWKETTDSENNPCYTVPAWRTQPLSSSFAYIINLMTTPSISISE